MIADKEGGYGMDILTISIAAIYFSLATATVATDCIETLPVEDPEKKPHEYGDIIKVYDVEFVYAGKDNGKHIVHIYNVDTDSDGQADISLFDVDNDGKIDRMRKGPVDRAERICGFT